MAITYGFYNSMNGDRKYDAIQMSSIFDGVIRDGVFQSIGGYLATKPGTGMQVIVSPGKAWFDHTWTVNDADLPLEIAQSDLTLSRYDAVILETDATKSVRENSIKVLKVQDTLFSVRTATLPKRIPFWINSFENCWTASGFIVSRNRKSSNYWLCFGFSSLEKIEVIT